MRSTLPRMGSRLRTLTRERLSILAQNPRRANILNLLDAFPSNDATSSHRPPVNPGYIMMPAHTWRQNVCDLVQEIVSPQIVSWMDDDDQDSAAHLCRRALYEIESRFVSSVNLFQNMVLTLCCNPQSFGKRVSCAATLNGDARGPYLPPCSMRQE